MADGWGLQGLIIIQSGQPYSVIDYSGAVGSIYYGIYDGITNPIDRACLWLHRSERGHRG